MNHSSSSAIRVDADFPGGNVIVDSIDGDTLNVRQDLRDTTTDWFYWCFRVRGAAGRSLTVRFTASNVIGARGPAVSLDGGLTWRWLGMAAVEGQTFRYAVPAGTGDVRFSFGMPYLQANLDAFLAGYRNHPNLEAGVLCATPKGRKVEWLRAGRLDGRAEQKVFITARHHCCEMMASYALEGLLDTVLAGSGPGAWLRENVEFGIVPFVDKDGVEQGDQGKNRAPRDHNRDYIGESVHATTRAIRELIPAWSAGKLRFALDLHCPWIRGGRNESIYFVGGENMAVWERVLAFCGTLSRVQTGPLVYDPKDNLPFGVDWNVAANQSAGMPCSRWTSGLPGIRVGSSIEIPYANANGVEVNAASARLLGRDVAAALREYLAP
jgi:hypothetical protein